MIPQRLLGIYINDHRAAAAGGVALARRAQRNNRGTPLGAELHTIVDDLLDDAATLESVAGRLSIRGNVAKRYGARIAELVSRLKLNGRIRTYSPLSRLLELESLLAGIDGKRSLWRSVSAAAAEQLPDMDFEILVTRATDQRSRLKPYHHAAAEEALRA